MPHRLTCHPDTPTEQVRSVVVEWTANDANEALLTFVVDGAEALVVPESRSPVRTHDLWRTTCFELLWKPIDGQPYFEFNFSPSLCWAAYAFDAYRSGMRDQPMAVDPVIETTRGGGLALEVDVDFSTLPGTGARVGLSAVIEEAGGTKSYWALRHPPGKPDFHHPDCFALTVPATAEQ